MEQPISQNSAQQQGEPITLAQINELLNAAGFPIINRQSVEILQGLAPRERIIRAIRLAKTDPGARAYLTDLFKRANIALQQPAHRQQNASEPQDQMSEQNDYANYDGHYEDNQPSRSPRQSDNRDERYQSNSQSQQRSRGNGGDGNGNGRMNPEDRESVHVYGGKAALCFEADMTKGDVPTIALDAATSTGPRQYDWNNKLRLQMTRAELPVVTAVLIGAMQRCEFKNHGQDNSKGFSMERQDGGKVFIKVFGKDQPIRAIPVMPADVFYVASLFMRQLLKASPWLDATALMSMIRATQVEVRPQQRNTPQ